LLREIRRLLSEDVAAGEPITVAPVGDQGEKHPAAATKHRPARRAGDSQRTRPGS
jgi:hypothetical protein